MGLFSSTKPKSDRSLYLAIAKEKKPDKWLRFTCIDDTLNLISNKFKVNMHVLKDGTVISDYINTNTRKHEHDITPYNLIDVEWLEDIEVKGKKVIGRAIVGSLLAGPAGMIIGGVTGQNKTKDNSIAVVTLQNQSTHKVRMLSFKCTKADFKKYKDIPKSEMIEDVSAVEVVAPVVDSLDQLKKLKELLDLDIITQDEFDQKKAQLLAL